MATANIQSGVTLRYGPGSSYDTAGSTYVSETCEIKWAEGQYYYAKFTSLNKCLYVEASDAHLIPGTGTPSTFRTTSSPKYINVVSNPYLGDNTSFSKMYTSTNETVTYMPRSQEVTLLGKTAGNLTFIEYKPIGSVKKRRAWYNSSYLLAAPTTMSVGTYKGIIDNIDPYQYGEDAYGETHCNEFAQVVMRDCGTPLPDGWCEYMYDLLDSNTFSRWRRTGYRSAQEKANSGCPAIAIEPSHIAVVYPNGSTLPSSIRDVMLAQGGASPTKHDPLYMCWPEEKFNIIDFFYWQY